ncbi:MAG: protein-L-isoaspartate O-methyltransferase [Verrucomicrobia bacterium A1]|nr:MAG: protein-L-isoaspartate O-methyltransferase [Verrucomicrobia bacterium A1]
MRWELIGFGLLLGVGVLLVTLCSACGRAPEPGQEPDWTAARAAMVTQLRAYGVRSQPVLDAMTRIPRHAYIPAEYRGVCPPYGDHPCPIGHRQTISQPYIVAYMTEKIAPRPGEKILEIGTGSGYQAAVLAELGADVYTIEIIPELAEHARRVLESEGYSGVHVRAGDGYKGWPEHSPFDAVIITCAPEEVPQTLVEQLKDGGRMILPLGGGAQRLVILRKKSGQIEKEEDLPVMFVPMVHGRDG